MMTRFAIRNSAISRREAEAITRWLSKHLGNSSIGRLWEYDVWLDGYLWWIEPDDVATLFRLRWGDYPMVVT